MTSGIASAASVMPAMTSGRHTPLAYGQEALKELAAEPPVLAGSARARLLGVPGVMLTASPLVAGFMPAGAACRAPAGPAVGPRALTWPPPV